MYDVRITVIKRSVNIDIVKEYLKDKYQEIEPCERLKEGQEFLITKENRYQPPKDFCQWAWADIRHDILTLAYGAKMPHMKNEDANIVACTDWFRPVYFLIEKIE